MDKKDIRKHIIDNGIKNLKEFGYPQVDEKNILNNTVYSAFFLSMLEENVGTDSRVDEVLKELIEEINENNP
ncbi:MAG: hypothetical protein KJO69_04730 [Gammaproteobacteria bacterium]|nr:hypothetical protein [Gammaproteobacteria bacterium]